MLHPWTQRGRQSGYPVSGIYSCSTGHLAHNSMPYKGCIYCNRCHYLHPSPSSLLFRTSYIRHYSGKWWHCRTFATDVRQVKRKPVVNHHSQVLNRLFWCYALVVVMNSILLLLIEVCSTSVLWSASLRPIPAIPDHVNGSIIRPHQFIQVFSPNTRSILSANPMIREPLGSLSLNTSSYVILFVMQNWGGGSFQ